MQIEIIRRVAEIFGQVLFKLEKVNKHLKYKEQCIQFYKEICVFDDDELRQLAVYNLPCLNLLYKKVESEMNINFQELWLKFIEDENQDIKLCAASSLHEAFKTIESEEDISNYRKAFIKLIVDNNRDIILLMNKNLDTLIEMYGNKHTIDNFKGRTAYIDKPQSDEGVKESTPTSIKASGSKAVDDFSSAFLETHKKKL